jgi:E3 ubiquitin-protein ligase NEDD4
MSTPILPPGWEKRYDSTDGRPYFIDLSTGTTTRESPYTSGRYPLPPGWEKRLTLDGHWYYLDHNSRTTSWSFGDDDYHHGGLADGWERRITMGGSIYFSNRETGATAEKHPGFRSPPPYGRGFLGKVVWLRGQPAMRKVPGVCNIKLRVVETFEDTCAAIMASSQEDLRKEIVIDIDGRGQDLRSALPSVTPAVYPVSLCPLSQRMVLHRFSSHISSIVWPIHPLDHGRRGPPD